MENQDFKKDMQETFKFFEQTEPNLYIQKKLVDLQVRLMEQIDDFSDKDILFLNLFAVVMNYQKVQRQLTDPLVEMIEQLLKDLPEQLKNMLSLVQSSQRIMKDVALLAFGKEKLDDRQKKILEGLAKD